MNENIRKMFSNRKSLSQKVFFHLGLNQNEPKLYVSTVSRELKTPYNSVYYWITKFKQEGLIDNKFFLTSRGNKVFRFLWELKDIKLLRAHNMQVVFYLSTCPVEFVKRYSDKIFTIFTNGRFKGLNGELETPFGIISIMFYSRNKIVCVLKDILGESDEDISSAVASQIPDIIQLLESKFQGIKIDSHRPARMQTSHIAALDSNFAKKFNLENITYEGKNVAMDCSHGRDELELTNPRNNLRGIEILKKWEEELERSLNINESSDN